MAQGHRPDRVGDQIRQELSELLARGVVHDPGIGFITVTRVQVTADLQLARVYYTTMGDQGARRETAKALQRATPFLRRHVGGRLQLRRVRSWNSASTNRSAIRTASSRSCAICTRKRRSGENRMTMTSASRRRGRTVPHAIRHAAALRRGVSCATRWRRGRLVAGDGLCAATPRQTRACAEPGRAATAAAGVPRRRRTSRSSGRPMIRATP